MITILTSALGLVLAASSPAGAQTARQIDQAFLACIRGAAGEVARAECSGVALPKVRGSITSVVDQILAKLNGDDDQRETAALLRAAQEAYPASRDADCRLRTKVTEGDETIFRECVYAADKARLEQFERFLHYAID